MPVRAIRGLRAGAWDVHHCLGRQPATASSGALSATVFHDVLYYNGASIPLLDNAPPGVHGRAAEAVPPAASL